MVPFVGICGALRGGLRERWQQPSQQHILSPTETEEVWHPWSYGDSDLVLLPTTVGQEN